MGAQTRPPPFPMCGIGLLVSPPRGRALHGSEIRELMSAVRHRGPDDEGFCLIDAGGELHAFGGDDTPAEVYRSGLPGNPQRSIHDGAPAARVAMGHRRLAIVDRSPSGHQPMVSADGRYVIAYNGEVYNFAALRRALQAEGCEFRTPSDTEVVLQAFIRWGPSCLRRFNGDFAFAIYDRESRRLFAARDRFAVRPLYLYVAPDGTFAVVSEIKQLTTVRGFHAVLNAQRAYDFLNWGLTDHTEETLFAGVRQLRGGELIDCAIDQLATMPTPKRWYELAPAQVSTGYEDAVQDVRDLFFDSVGLRMHADVPVGTALSGGLDSSSIVCAVNHLLRTSGSTQPQRTFSSCSEIRRFDERHHIDEVVHATGVDAHYTYPNVDMLFDNLDALTWHQDEPYGSTSIFAEWDVYRLVATTPVRVTLDGHGADELFGGYHSFYGPRLLESLAKVRLRDFARELRGMQKLHRYGPPQVAGFLLNAALPDRALQIARSAAGKIPQTGEWFAHDEFPVDREAPTATYFREAMSVAGYSRSMLAATGLPLQLHWADRDSMAHGVESRVPFLDHRLVEYVLGCPARFKIRGGTTKAILRAAMRPYLPLHTARRTDKMGFVTAEEHWVQNDAPERFRREIDGAAEAARPVVNELGRERALRIISGEERFNTFAWRFISFGKWMRAFQVAPR